MRGTYNVSIKPPYEHDQDTYPPHGKHSLNGSDPAPWCRIPLHYLRWMIQVRHNLQHIAYAELDRRGTAYRESFVEISSHAVDMASIKLLALWEQDRNDNEGLHAWLSRISEDCYYVYTDGLGDADKSEQIRVQHKTGVFVLNVEMAEPVLITCYPAKEDKHYDAQTE